MTGVKKAQARPVYNMSGQAARLVLHLQTLDIEMFYLILNLVNKSEVVIGILPQSKEFPIIFD